MAMTRWANDIRPTPAHYPLQPVTTPWPSPCRVLRRIEREMADMAMNLHRSLDAAGTDANDHQLEPAGELLVWIEACRDEAGKIARDLEASHG